MFYLLDEYELPCVCAANVVGCIFPTPPVLVLLQGREDAIMATIKDARRHLAASVPTVSLEDVFGCTAAVVICNQN